ncbi:cytochrome P450 [Streptomyces sp. NPDC001594]|uniref:cytochrome P450 n=1 Tax=Streptomyces sp. NPDC001594 TaxID=3364590 RepID=UPI0036879342
MNTTPAPTPPWPRLRFADAPGALPGIGHGLAALKDPLGFLTGLAAHGDLVLIRVGTWRAYVACHPEVAYRVLQDDRTYDKGGRIIDKASTFGGTGILMCPHVEHRRRRRIVQPAFDRRHLRQYAAVMSRHIDRITNNWQNDQPITPLHEASSITASVAAETFFGETLTTAEIAEMKQSVTTVFADAYRQVVSPAPLLRLPTKRNSRYEHARRHLRTTVQKIITTYRDRGADGSDLLAHILEERNETDGGLTDDEAYNEILGLLLAGVETTANLIAWACLMLAQNPHIQNEVAAETREVLDGRAATWEDLSHLQVTTRVINETLRMYPPAWVSSRIVRHDSDLVPGHTVPAGSTVLYSPYLLHHRSDLYEEPALFNPDRWLDPRTPQRARDGFIPFAAGGRQCIGNDFGFSQATLTLATITDRWHLDPPPAHPTPRVHLTLSPPPTSVRANRRLR